MGSSSGIAPRATAGVSRFRHGVKEPGARSAEPARRAQAFAREPPGSSDAKEHGHPRDVFRLSQASERRLGDHELFEVAPDDALAVQALRFPRRPGDGVHSNLPIGELLGKHASDGVERAFVAEYTDEVGVAFSLATELMLITLPP